jgi:hypothetical protein
VRIGPNPTHGCIDGISFHALLRSETELRQHLPGAGRAGGGGGMKMNGARAVKMKTNGAALLCYLQRLCRVLVIRHSAKIF